MKLETTCLALALVVAIAPAYAKASNCPDCQPARTDRKPRRGQRFEPAVASGKHPDDEPGDILRKETELHVVDTGINWLS